MQHITTLYIAHIIALVLHIAFSVYTDIKIKGGDGGDGGKFTFI